MCARDCGELEGETAIAGGRLWLGQGRGNDSPTAFQRRVSSPGWHKEETAFRVHTWLDKACCVQGTESRSLGLEHRGVWRVGGGVKTSGMFYSEF